MGCERFKPQFEDSFFGRIVYDRIIPRDHFLVQLNEIVPWQRFTYKLVKYYRGKAKEGRPPYDPAVLLKMLLVSFLYDLSEREVEELARFNLPVKYFLGLAADELPPDHSTLTAFKARIIENGRLTAFDNLLAEVVSIAREKGIRFGSIHVYVLMDSVHTVADVNPEKDRRNRRDGRPRRDPNARVGVKNGRVTTDADGEMAKGKEYFLGYKDHVSYDALSEMITSMIVTPGNAYDGHQLPKLLQKDLEQGLPVSIVTADRGYDDSDNHFLLSSKGIASAIRLNSYRLQKKDPHKTYWQEVHDRPQYDQGLKERYKIERKFGEAKTGHGFRRCRYVGIVGYGIQSFLTAMVLNLKRMVLLLTGVPFKGRARALA
jgi:IS5 family transposase